MLIPALALLFPAFYLGLPGVSGHSGTVLAAYTTAAPVMDGAIGASEWASAATYSFSITGDRGTVYSGIIFEMNDLSNLYVAVRINDDEANPGDNRVAFVFDNNHAGGLTLPAGSDLIECDGGSANSHDRFWDGSAWIEDVSDGGNTNVACSYSRVGSNNEYELNHPLCTAGSGDLASGRVHDFCRVFGDTVGFLFGYRDSSGMGGFSEFATSPTISNPADLYSGAPSSFHEIKVVGPDFSLGSSVATVTVTQGSSGTATITATSLYTFSSPITLSVSWIGTAPSGVTFSLPSPVTPSSGSPATSPLIITASSGASTGAFAVRVTGTSGSLSHNVAPDIAVQVNPAATTTTTSSTSTSSTSSTSTTSAAAPDFSLSSTTTTILVSQGGSGSSTITVASLNGFSSAVALSGSWVGTAPSDVNTDLASPVTPASGSTATSTLTVTASSTASVGTFTLRVTGTSGALPSHSVDIGVQVTAGATSTTTSPPAPKCLIATATYGSELSPEVQLLRNFRDYSVMKTKAGSNFMVAFNAWYYSFSPYVANYLTQHWVERTVMKGVLYPLIGILFLSSKLFSVTNSSPELASLLSGLLASSLIGAFYVGLPLGVVRARIRRRPGERAQRLLNISLGSALLLGLGGLTIGELFASSTLLILSTSTIVVTTLFLCAAVTSAKLAKRFHSL